jgi:hypothetical protein
MKDATQTTSKIGPILDRDGKIKAKDSEMAPELNDFLCNQMTPSTDHNINWNVTYEPKGRQLNIANIQVKITNNPLGNPLIRKYITSLHQELENYGYIPGDNDIIDCHPLGTLTRGQTSLPIVITYKDNETAASVKRAAIKAGLWEQRNQHREEKPPTQETQEIQKKPKKKPWFKKKPACLKKDTEQNESEENNDKKGFFTDPSKTLDIIYTYQSEIRKAIRKSKRKSAAGPDELKMSVYSEACENLIFPLQALFNTINSTGLIPENFKTAKVILLHKKKYASANPNFLVFKYPPCSGRIITGCEV